MGKLQQLDALTGREVTVNLYSEGLTVGHLNGELGTTSTKGLPMWRVSAGGHGCMYFGTTQVTEIDEFESANGTPRVTLVVDLALPANR